MILKRWSFLPPFLLLILFCTYLFLLVGLRREPEISGRFIGTLSSQAFFRNILFVTFLSYLLYFSFFMPIFVSESLTN